MRRVSFVGAVGGSLVLKLALRMVFYRIVERLDFRVCIQNAGNSATVTIMDEYKQELYTTSLWRIYYCLKISQNYDRMKKQQMNNNKVFFVKMRSQREGKMANLMVTFK